MKKSDIVKIFRIDDRGFSCKPYTSSAYHHVFEFIDVEITDLWDIENTIVGKMLHRPAKDDLKWSGCFCFLNEFDYKLTHLGNALDMRHGEKLNMLYLSKESNIWVRNCSHLGKDKPFYNSFIYPIVHENKEYWFESANHYRFQHLKWVRMNVSLAIRRTELWKKENPNTPLPEWLTEFYLLEDQLLDTFEPSKIRQLLYLCKFFKETLRFIPWAV